MLKEQKVVSSQVNSKSQLSIVGSFQIIQDAITELTETLKIDGPTLKEKYNAFWVFAKTRVRFLKPLCWNERILVNVVISNISVAKITVDVEIKNKLGEVCEQSKTELCVLDQTTKKIRKVASVGVTESMLSNSLTDISFSRLDREILPVDSDVKIRYTNIDFCHHTNNLEYVRLIMNTYSVSEMESRFIKEFQIIYINQSFENDVLVIHKQSEQQSDYFELTKDSQPIVKCEIVF